MESKTQHFEGKCDESNLHRLKPGFDDIQVVEHENRRPQAISFFPKEIEQVGKDICSFFDAHVNRDPNSPRLDIIDSVPGAHALRSLLYQWNEVQAIWIYDYELLRSQEIIDLYSRNIARGLVPFAANVDGDYICAGLDDHDGGAFCVDGETGEVESVEAQSLATYLEEYRNMLLSGRLEYIQDYGMVERTLEPATTTTESKK